jgi:hypothetical protein
MEKVGLLVLIVLAVAANLGTYAISELITKERAANETPREHRLPQQK